MDLQYAELEECVELEDLGIELGVGLERMKFEELELELELGEFELGSTTDS